MSSVSIMVALGIMSSGMMGSGAVDTSSDSGFTDSRNIVFDEENRGWIADGAVIVPESRDTMVEITMEDDLFFIGEVLDDNWTFYPMELPDHNEYEPLFAEEDSPFDVDGHGQAVLTEELTTPLVGDMEIGDSGFVPGWQIRLDPKISFWLPSGTIVSQDEGRTSVPVQMTEDGVVITLDATEADAISMDINTSTEHMVPVQIATE